MVSKLLPVKALMWQDVPCPKMTEMTALIPTDLNGFYHRTFPYYKSSA